MGRLLAFQAASATFPVRRLRVAMSRVKESFRRIPVGGERGRVSRPCPTGAAVVVA